MVDRNLVIGCIALSLGVVILAIAIVAIYYSVKPSSVTLGNITTGSISASGPVSTLQSFNIGGNTTTSGTFQTSQNLTVNTTSSIGGNVTNTQTDSAGPLISTNATNSTSATTGALTNAGGIGVAKSINVGNALYLPNLGTALTTYPINYYEEFIINTTVNGPWATTQPWILTLAKFQNLVTCTWITATALGSGSNSLITSAADIPSRFLNRSVGISTFSFPVQVQNNNTYQMGTLKINLLGGTITFYSDTAGSQPFSAIGGLSSIIAGCESWTTN